MTPEENAESIRLLQRAILDLESHAIVQMGLGRSSNKEPGEAMVRFNLDSEAIRKIRQLVEVQVKP